MRAAALGKQPKRIWPARPPARACISRLESCDASQHLSGTLREWCTRGCREYPSSRTFEQRDAKPIFQEGHLLRDGRWRVAQIAGGFSERTAMQNLQEGPQVYEINHGFSASIASGPPSRA